MTQQLEPCPFCGFATSEVRTTLTYKIAPAKVFRAWVECQTRLTCGPRVSSDSSKDEAKVLAVTLWNRRKDHHGYTIDNEAGDDDPASWQTLTR